jgi:hypothetical protein
MPRSATATVHMDSTHFHDEPAQDEKNELQTWLSSSAYTGTLLFRFLSVEALDQHMQRRRRSL